MTNNDMTAAYMGVSAVTKICLGEDVVWPTNPYYTVPLTLDILSGGEIRFKKRTIQAENKTISYSKDNGQTWSSITASDTTGVTFNVSAGDIVQLKGTNNTYAASSTNCVSFSGSTATFNAYGNIMSLIYGDNYQGKTSFPNGTSHNFAYLFGYTNIKSAENLILPATALTSDCYTLMFRRSQLEVAPVLPAHTLAAAAYENMFADCGSLRYIKCLATNISATNCTNGWVTNVPSTGGTFVKAASMSSWTRGISGIPTNWTVIDA